MVSSLCVIDNVKFGKNVKYFNFVNLYGCEIGDDTKIGAFVEIQQNSYIGKRCKISSHSFVCEGVKIHDDVFIGHGVMFINDRFPRASIDGESIIDEWILEETVVEKGASIGSNATIMCGIKIGESAVVGCGAVVTKDVPKGSTVVGNPARVIKND